MLEEGAEPEQVDRVLVEFGFPLGPFAVADLGGLDVVLATRQARLARLDPARARGGPARAAERPRALRAKERGGLVPLRRGAARVAGPAGERAHRPALRARGITRRAIADAEILERCLYAMINEGARLIEDGVVPRAHEIDVIWLQGFGFPAYRGGPMFHADEIGLKVIHERLLHYREQVGAEYFTPAPLLARLARAG